jgi:hypothetical protein
MSDWPEGKLPSKGKPVTVGQVTLWNEWIDVAVAEIEARVGPHPKTPEYQVWLANKESA